MSQNSLYRGTQDPRLESWWFARGTASSSSESFRRACITSRNIAHSCFAWAVTRAVLFPMLLFGCVLDTATHVVTAYWCHRQFGTTHRRLDRSLGPRTLLMSKRSRGVASAVGSSSSTKRNIRGLASSPARMQSCAWKGERFEQAPNGARRTYERVSFLCAVFHRA